jgi:SAM-dependent methyltransferase
MKRCLSCLHLFDYAGWHCSACGYQPINIAGFPALAPELACEGGGFQPEYFSELAALESGNFWFQARNKLILWVLQRYFPNFYRFLEIGCGTGFVLSGVAKAFPEAVLTGSEVFSVSLAYAANRLSGAEFLQMDARHLPYVEHFDVVGAFDVLEHIVEDEQVLAEIHKALRPDGGLVLTVPQHRWLWSRQDESACHVRRYTATELRRKVLAAGFIPLYETSFVSLLLPMMWLSRLQKSWFTEKNDPMSELRIGQIANRLLGTVMTIERGFIRSGIRFPIGGSLLLVARKS